MAYDPKKAHEYYMAHRKLKGRKKGRKGRKYDRSSTKPLNDAGLKAYEEAKKKVSEERKAFTKLLNKYYNDQIKALKNKLKGLTGDALEQTQKEVDSLQDKFKEHKDLARKYFDEVKLRELDGIKQDKANLK